MWCSVGVFILFLCLGDFSSICFLCVLVYLVCLEYYFVEFLH